MLIVVATKKPDSIIDDYSKRWSIETMFGNIKSRGFDLGFTHKANLDLMGKHGTTDDCCCVVLTSRALVLWGCKSIAAEQALPCSQESVSIRIG
ncbi:MAG: hypothetical protein QS721_09785 [Candidatus Endonucleobacter sp. (ex Gigantidas childressi)]|nr:hypothetical protein [Candidatus Endonucleobacter sp. (ex Gigantidas childressi)]